MFIPGFSPQVEAAPGSVISLAVSELSCKFDEKVPVGVCGHQRSSGDQCFGLQQSPHGTIQHSLAHEVVAMATSHSKLIVSSEINSLGIYC